MMLRDRGRPSTIALMVTRRSSSARCKSVHIAKDTLVPPGFTQSKLTPGLGQNFTVGAAEDNSIAGNGRRPGPSPGDGDIGAVGALDDRCQSLAEIGADASGHRANEGLQAFTSVALDDRIASRVKRLGQHSRHAPLEGLLLKMWPHRGL